MIRRSRSSTLSSVSEVKVTRCFCFLFIPIFPLDAYRVADAPGRGWYFLGKEKVGGFARGVRWCGVAVVVFFGGLLMYGAHVGSPEYKSREAREKADAHVAEGKPMAAAGIYRGMLYDGVGDPSESKSWLGALKSATKEAPCAQLQSTLEGALQVVALEALAADRPDCAVIIEANRRLIGPHAILRLLIRAKGELGERVHKHPAVVEAREASVCESELFPGSFGLEDWVLLDGLHPESDAKLKELVASYRSEPLGRKLERELQHETPGILIGDFWEKVFSGDDQGARELLPKIEATGVKLPVLF